MAVTLAEGVVEVTADAGTLGRDIARAVDRGNPDVAASGRRMGSTLGDVFKGTFFGQLASSAFFAIGDMIGSSIRSGIQFAMGAIDIASDLNESFNAVNVSYGPIAAEIVALGETSAKTFGLSQRSLNGYATQFSSFSKTIAGDGGDVAGTFESILGRATDFASVMNTEVPDALGLFQSGLAGETEPLRKYGIDLSAAAVEAYAAAAGIGTVGEELTEQEKVQARYGKLLQDTSAFQGDFANTSDELANKNRINAATWDDLQAKIGDKFLPIAAGLATVLADKVFPAIDAMITEHGPALGEMFEDAVPAMQEFAEEILPKIPPLLETLAENLPGMIEGFTEFTNWIIELVTSFRLVSPETEAFLGNVGKTVEGVVAFVTNVGTNIEDFFANLGLGLEDGTIWETFAGFVAGMWESVVGAFAGGATQLNDFFTGIGTAVGKMWGSVMGAFANGAAQLNNFFADIGRAIGTAIGEFGRFAGEVGANIGKAVEWVAGLPGRAAEALGDLGNDLFRSGQSLIQGFIDGIKDMIGDVGAAVGDVVEWAASFFPNSPAKRGPLSGAGWTKLGQSGGAVIDQFLSGMDVGRIGAPSVIAELGATRPASAGRTIGGGLGATSGGVAGVGGQTVNIEINEATDPLGSAGRVGAELRKWKVSAA